MGLKIFWTWNISKSAQCHFSMVIPIVCFFVDKRPFKKAFPQLFQYQIPMSFPNCSVRAMILHGPLPHHTRHTSLPPSSLGYRLETGNGWALTLESEDLSSQSSGIWVALLLIGTSSTTSPATRTHTGPSAGFCSFGFGRMPANTAFTVIIGLNLNSPTCFCF